METQRDDNYCINGRVCKNVSTSYIHTYSTLRGKGMNIRKINSQVLKNIDGKYSNRILANSVIVTIYEMKERVLERNSTEDEEGKKGKGKRKGYWLRVSSELRV